MTAPTIRPMRDLLWQPRNWTYWVYLAAAVAGLIAVVQLFHPMRLLTTSAAVTAVVGFLALGTVVGLIIVWLTVIHRPPTSLLVAAVLWGGAVAVAIGVYVNDDLLSVLPHVAGIGTANDWGAAIAGPTDEEWLKATGVLAVLALGGRAITRPVQGLFVGAWCGLGFQVVEDFTYAMNGALGNTSSDLAGVMQSLQVRGVLGLLPSHWVYTACTGYGIGYALLRRDRPLPVRVLFAIAMFAVGWSMHFLWNSPLITPQLGLFGGMVTKLVIILAGFFVVYRLAMRAEWRWYRRVVHAEPAVAAATARAEEALVTDDEIRSLRTRRRRFLARRSIRRSVRRQVRPAVRRGRAKKLGKQASRLARRLQRAQGWVAMTAAYEPDQLPALRTRITALRSELAGLGDTSTGGAKRDDRQRRHRRADRQRERSGIDAPREERGTDPLRTDRS